MAHNQQPTEGWDLPEVVPNREPPILATPSDLPEVSPSEGLESAYGGTQGTESTPTTGYIKSAGTTPEPGLDTGGGKVPAYNSDPAAAPEVAEKRNGFWTKKKIWIAAGVGVVAVIALALGLGLGLTLGKSKNSDEGSPPLGGGTDDDNTNFGSPISLPPSDADASESVCVKEGWCPSLLSSVKPSSDSPNFMLFARNTDNEACFREHDGTEWTDDDWSCLGGEIESQPALVVQVQGRVHLFAVQKETLKMRIRTRRGSAWDPNWGDLKGTCYSPPTVCSQETGHMMVWTTSSKQEVAYKRYADEDWTPNMDAEWDRAVTGKLASSPVGVCLGPESVDVVAYGNKDDDSTGPFELMIKRGNNTKFDYWQYVGGDFRGDPAAVAMSDERIDFVGVGKDGDMYHATWADPDSWRLEGNDGPQSIGGVKDGKFVSQPSLLATGEDRLDVVAVGDDAQLWHHALKGSKWADGWELLGGWFNSAPHLRRLSDSEVVVFGIGPDNEVIHRAFKTDDGYSWVDVGGYSSQEDEWYSDNGTMATSWLRSGNS